MNKKLRWTLLIAWVIVIFFFSHMNAQESTEQSSIVVWLFTSFGLDITNWFGDMAIVLVRKAAHIFEFFVFCILVHNVLHLYLDDAMRYAYAFTFTAIIAFSDELHQTFITGRDGNFRDVLIDMIGGVIAILFLILYDYIKKARTIK